MCGLEWPPRSRGGWQTWPAEHASEGGRKIVGFLRLDFLRHTGSKVEAWERMVQRVSPG